MPRFAFVHLIYVTIVLKRHTQKIKANNVTLHHTPHTTYYTLYCLVCCLVVHCMVVWLTGIQYFHVLAVKRIVLTFYGPVRHSMIKYT